MKLLNLRNDEGFSLIELLIVVAIIGIIATIAVPQLMDAIDRGRQRRTMADMRNIATANGTYRVDEGEYADALGSLETDYMQDVPDNDGWGNAWVYAGGATYSLRSTGADGTQADYSGVYPETGEYDGDLVMSNGQFSCAPGLDCGGGG